jgi:hypothetical protein
MASLFCKKNNGAKAQPIATGKVAYSTVNRDKKPLLRKL